MPQWVLAVVTIGLVVFGTRRLMQMHVPSRLFMSALSKLAAAHNFDRARKLCRAIPDRGMARVAAEALALRLDAQVSRHEQARYRDAPAPLLFEDRVRAVLLPVALAERRVAGQSLTAAVAGGVLAVAMLALRRFAVDIFAVISVCSVLGSAYAAHIYRDILRGLDLALIELPSCVLPGDQMHGAAPTSPPPRSSVGGDGLVLSIVDTEGRASEVRLTDRIIKIGRAPTATITLEHTGILRTHAIIDRGRGDATLIDLGSAPSTTVNGAVVQRRELAVGDIIGIGPFRVEVIAIGPPAIPEPPP